MTFCVDRLSELWCMSEGFKSDRAEEWVVDQIFAWRKDERR